MPKYINKSTVPIYYGNTVFVPNKEAQTYNVIPVRAFTVGSVAETFDIVLGVNDELYIRFNEEIAWTIVTLTAGVARTAAQIVSDINTAYGSVVASSENGKIRLDAPIVSNILNSVYIATTAMGSTAAVTLGLTTGGANPVSKVSLQAFYLSENAENYVVTSANNNFIFKVNNSDWITATLTIGAARTAAEVVADINSAYEIATGDPNKVAFAVVPVTIGGNVHVKLAAPIINNTDSRLYIKTTGNTSLILLDIESDDYNPIAVSSYPMLYRTSVLPLFNPIISETIVTFAVAGTQYYYISDPVLCKVLQINRVTIGGGLLFNIYLEDVSNTPPITLGNSETFEMNLQNYKFSKLVIVTTGTGSLTIRELIS